MTTTAMLGSLLAGADALLLCDSRRRGQDYRNGDEARRSWVTLGLPNSPALVLRPLWSELPRGLLGGRSADPVVAFEELGEPGEHRLFFGGVIVGL